MPLPLGIKPLLDEFLTWWCKGLLMLLPERWLAWVRHTPDIVTVDQEAEVLTFKLYDGNTRKLRKERSIPRGDVAEQAAINSWLGRHENELKLILLLPQDKHLKKRLTYPMSSEKELRAVLGFEMDKQTPFTNDSVSFDYTVIRRDTINGKVHVNLYVVLRKTLKTHLDALQFLDLKPAAASTTGTDKSMEDINLIPESGRKRQDSPVRQLMLLGLLAFTLLMMSLYIPLLHYGSMAEQLDKQVEQGRIQAMQGQALVNRKQAILARVDFLSDQTRRHVPVMHLFGDLTRRLPDNTWIYQLIINKGEIQMQGESETAASVIRLIEESNYFEQVQFRSPVTKNNATRKEQFHLAARISIEK